MYSCGMDYTEILKQQIVEVATAICPRLDDISADACTEVHSYDLRRLHAALSDLEDYKRCKYNLAPILGLLPDDISKIWVSAADFVVVRKYSSIEPNPTPKAEETLAWLVLNSGRTVYIHISRKIMEGACYLDQEKRLPESLDYSLFRLLPWTEKCERPIGYI